MSTAEPTLRQHSYVEYADLGEAVKTFPLLAEVVLVSDDDDVLEFAVVVVTGA